MKKLLRVEYKNKGMYRENWEEFGLKSFKGIDRVMSKSRQVFTWVWRGFYRNPERFLYRQNSKVQRHFRQSLDRVLSNSKELFINIGIIFSIDKFIP